MFKINCWLYRMGLAPTAETMVLARQGSNILTNWNMLQTETSSIAVTGGSATGAVSANASTSEAPDVVSTLREWKSALSLSVTRDTNAEGDDEGDQSGNPMLRCLVREASTATRVLNVVRTDVEEMLRLCEEEDAKATYDVKVMLQTVSLGLTPRSWLKRLSNPSRQATTWVHDLVARCQQVKVSVWF
jgi:hypothetical protein